MVLRLEDGGDIFYFAPSISKQVNLLSSIRFKENYTKLFVMRILVYVIRLNSIFYGQTK